MSNNIETKLELLRKIYVGYERYIPYIDDILSTLRLVNNKYIRQNGVYYYTEDDNFPVDYLDMLRNRFDHVEGNLDITRLEYDEVQKQSFVSVYKLLNDLYKNFFDILESFNVFEFIKQEIDDPNFLTKWAKTFETDIDYVSYPPSHYADILKDALIKAKSYVEEKLYRMANIIKTWDDFLRKNGEQRRIAHIVDSFDNTPHLDDGSTKSILTENPQIKLLGIVSKFCQKQMRRLDDITSKTKLKSFIKEFITHIDGYSSRMISNGLENDSVRLSNANSSFKQIYRDLTTEEETKTLTDINTYVGDIRSEIDRLKFFIDGSANDKQRKIDVKQQKYRTPFVGVPSYRFAVGNRVVVNQSRRHGKVISVEKDGGNGKQLYRVKLDSSDEIKTYSVNELSHEA